MDELLNIHGRFSDLIKETFRDDPAFVSALDKVNLSVHSLDEKRDNNNTGVLVFLWDTAISKTQCTLQYSLHLLYSLVYKEHS